MPEEVMVKLYEPTSREVDEILKMHNDNFKTQQKKQYYSTLVSNATNPFWIAVNADNDELLGFIATRIDYQKSIINIVSMTERRDVQGVLSLLLKKVVKDAKVIKIAEITTQSRSSSTEIRDALKNIGFTESKNGKFKDGEVKYQYQLQMKKGKKYLMKPYGKKRTNIKPLPTPKKGYYKIRDAKSSDVGEVTIMHNKFLAKKREEVYFRNKLNAKDGAFLVAIDSNGSVAGYITCRPERKAGFTKGSYTRLNLVSIGVGEEYRGWGIAKGLIAKIIERAKKFPTIEFIYGHVRGKNISARKLYKRMGFKLRKIGKYKDDKDDKYEFYLRLRFPSVKPYLVKYQQPIIWFAVGVMAHEAIHLVRNYE